MPHLSRFYGAGEGAQAAVTAEAAESAVPTAKKNIFPEGLLWPLIPFAKKGDTYYAGRAENPPR